MGRERERVRVQQFTWTTIYHSWFSRWSENNVRVTKYECNHSVKRRDCVLQLQETKYVRLIMALNDFSNQLKVLQVNAQRFIMLMSELKDSWTDNTKLLFWQRSHMSSNVGCRLTNNRTFNTLTLLYLTFFNQNIKILSYCAAAHFFRSRAVIETG